MSHSNFLAIFFLSSNIVIENTKEASYRIRTKINNVAGVKLPIFDRAIGTVSGKGQTKL